MNPYTVVLIRPDTVAEQYGEDFYVALIEARTPKHAVTLAQLEVWNADLADGVCSEDDFSVDPEDYALVVLFNGHHQAALFGWQL